MQGGGLGLALAHMRNRIPTKKCDRCGLRYKITVEHCPHCHGLSEAELSNLKARIAREHKGHRRLGNMLLLAALVGLILMVLGAL